MTPWKRIAAEPGPKAWMQAFGLQVRRTREFLGLSQERLAKEAGTTQGTISRFEVGHALRTPYLGVMQIHQALALELRKLDPALLSEDARHFLTYAEALQPPRNGGPQPPPGRTKLAALGSTNGADVERLVRLYRALPEARRGPFVDVVTVVATALHD